jgi:hypothetical protein
MEITLAKLFNRGSKQFDVNRVLIPELTPAKMRPKPRYTHDCPRCAFLGCWAEYDLYFCSGAGMPTVIARYGNNGSDYSSGIGFTMTQLVIAEGLARRRGLLK